MVRLGVHEISVNEYLWSSLWWKRLEEEVCFKSGVKIGVINGENGGDDSVNPTCVG